MNNIKNQNMYKYNIEKRHNNNNNKKNMFILTCYVIIINVHNVLSASASFSSPLLNNVIRIENLENNIISIRAPEAKIGGADDVIINLENNKGIKDAGFR